MAWWRTRPLGTRSRSRLRADIVRGRSWRVKSAMTRVDRVAALLFLFGVGFFAGFELGAEAGGVAFFVGLSGAADGEGGGGDVLGDGGGGGDVGAVADGDGGDELGVAADEDVFADAGLLLGVAVVVAEDGAGADVGVFADVAV